MTSENNICKTLTFSSKGVQHSAIAISSHDVFALSTDIGLHVTVNLNSSIIATRAWRLLNVPINKDQNICFNTTVIPLGDILQFDVGVSRLQLHSQFDFDHLDEMYKVMVDRTLSPAVKSSVSYRNSKVVEWSPEGADPYRRPVLAVLSHDHRLSIYQVEASRKKYDLILDLSVEFNKFLQEENFAVVTNRINTSSNPKSDFIKVHHRTYALAAVDMVWSDIWRSDIENFSLMFVVMKSGHLVIWKVCFPVTPLSFELMEMVDIGNDIPSTLQVIRVNSNKCLVLVGYNNGQLRSFLIWRHLKEFEVQENTKLWTDKDDIAINHITWLGQKNVLLCGKGVFLLAFQLDMNVDGQLQIVQESHIIASDKLPITEICHKHKKMFISVQDGTIFQCEVNVNPEIKIELTTFPIIRPTAHVWGSNGLALTQNEVYLFEVSSPLSAYDHLALVDPLRVNCIQLKSPETVSLELAKAAESEDKLFRFKDLLVCVKNHILKEGSIPGLLSEWLIQKETWTDKAFTWLKILRYLLQVKMTHCNITSTFKLKTDEEQKTKREVEEDLEVVEKLILLKHTCERLQLLIDVEKEQGLSGSDITCICLMSKFIQNCSLSNESQKSLAVSVCKKLNLSVHGNLPPVLERCKICNADISTKFVYNENCPNGHNIGRCSQTLMICQELPYRVCENCQMLAVGSHIKGSDWFEALKSIYCTFCDGTVK